MTECKPEPTKLTRDQAIRAKALEIAISALSLKFLAIKKGKCFHDIVFELEDYIRDGRKGDE